MSIKAVRFVLREYNDLIQSRIDQVAEGEVDKSISAPERDCGLRPVRGQRHEPLTLSTSKDNAENLL